MSDEREKGLNRTVRMAAVKIPGRGSGAIQLAPMLMDELAARVTTPRRAAAVIAAANRLKESSPVEQESRLPATYLLFERYLVEIDPGANASRAELRAWVQADFPALLQKHRFKLIFEDESKQEIFLCRAFLHGVLARAISILGPGADSQWAAAALWLEEVPDTALPAPFGLATPQAGTGAAWIQLFRQISDKIRQALDAGVGEEGAVRLYESAYLELHDIYRDLETFPAVINLLPDSLLDADKINSMSRAQMQRTLIEKTENLQRVNQEMTKVNAELEAAQTLLQLAKTDLEGRVETRTVELQRAYESLQESERRMRNILENVQLVAVQLDTAGRIMFANAYLQELTGYAAAELLGRNWFELMLPVEDRERVKASFMEKIMSGTIAPHDENPIVTRRGEPRLIAWNNTVLRDPAGSPAGTASIGIDITEQRRTEAQLQHDALHDALTGLPNRALFVDRLEGAIARARRRPGYLFAVLFCDLDRFKVINDSLGHKIGDELLIEVGRRLNSGLRAGDTVARIGGDEFCILLDDILGLETATQLADRIQRELTLPFNLWGQEAFTSASLGITLYTPRYQRPEELLRDADTAMYRAKAAGKARYEIFDTSMHQRAVTLMQLETDLRRAVERQEFMVLYQPIVNLESGTIMGFEALVRWRHPQRGLINPVEFIPLAEETGMVIPMGEWVLHEACRQLAEWDARHAHGRLHMSVNLSSKQFSHSNLVGQIENALHVHGLNSDRLKLEITESVFIANADNATAMLAQLRQKGFKVSIDDFGTGYSSLGYLLRFPLDVIKIDQSFVFPLNNDAGSGALVKTIIQLADSLKMGVVAEGVESAEHLGLLRAMGCAFGQGYHFARPISGDDALALVQSGQTW